MISTDNIEDDHQIIEENENESDENHFDNQLNDNLQKKNGNTKKKDTANEGRIPRIIEGMSNLINLCIYDFRSTKGY